MPGALSQCNLSRVCTHGRGWILRDDVCVSNPCNALTESVKGKPRETWIYVGVLPTTRRIRTAARPGSSSVVPWPPASTAESSAALLSASGNNATTASRPRGSKDPNLYTRGICHRQQRDRPQPSVGKGPQGPKRAVPSPQDSQAPSARCRSVRGLSPSTITAISRSSRRRLRVEKSMTPPADGGRYSALLVVRSHTFSLSLPCH